MKRLLFKLLLLADKFPDGFTLVLPDGTMINVQFLFGTEISETKEGISIRQAFGISFTGSDFDEVIVTLYVAG